MSVVPPRRRRRAEINIVPLVDVLVVLIFFFLVSMQFRNLTTLSLTLPDIETAGESQKVDHLEIAITPTGEIYLNGREVSEEKLKEQVALAAKVNRDIPVLVMADEESYLRYVTMVMDACRSAGLTKIRLQSR